MDRIALLDGWRYTSLESGGRCVTTDLILQKLRWRVDSWDSLALGTMEMSATHSMSHYTNNNYYY